MYNTAISSTLNDVMEVLTIFYFIPLTFIVGIYGTNLNVVSEPKYEYGSFVIWLK
ncbi:MAG: CorA family divalent cation transporter [Maribacter sp.]|uniref:CorA family divalent cation transporter n=1 Tax=Maribacter sp. TaxID=1897614 RepID=UPI003C749FFB